MNVPFYMKKLALITMKGHGLSIAFGNPKKAMSIRAASFEEASSNLDPAMVFPRRRKDLFCLQEMCGSRKWEFLVNFLTDRPRGILPFFYRGIIKYMLLLRSTDRPCGILRIPSSHFHFTSLIVRERGHHELCIVLTAIFSAATGDFPCRGKTHCAWNATHRIRCHT